MYKKILVAIAFFAIVFGVFGMVDTVSADAGPHWKADRPSPATDTLDGNYFQVINLTMDTSPLATGKLAGCNDTEFGPWQIHAVEADVATTTQYVRLRLEAEGFLSDNVGALAAGIYTTDLMGVPDFGNWVACGKIDTEGVLELVGEIPAGHGYGLVISSVGSFVPVEGWWEYIRTWVVVSDYESGGLILNTLGDCGNPLDRSFQVSTQDPTADPTAGDFTSSWTYAPIPGSNWQWFLDAPAGVYNLGVQDLGDAGHPDEPFVAYYEDIAIPGPGYEMMIMPCEDATKVVTASVDCAAQIEGADVFLNISEGDGFLWDDLTPGQLAAGTYDGELSFSITPWMYWDLAIVKDDDPMNYFLVAQSFNAIDREITFDLCTDGVDWIAPTEDEDWDSAQGIFVPPGNLDFQVFQLLGDVFADGYKSENVVLKVDPGCCGDNEPIEFVQMWLDNYDADCPVCPDCKDCDRATGAYEIPVDAPCCPEGYLCDVDRTGKWWYKFIPTVVAQDWGEDVLFGVGGLPLAGEVPDYTPIFGDGPFYMDPAGVSKLEYKASELAASGEVMHERGLWYDDFGNVIFDVEEWAWTEKQGWVLVDDIAPMYALQTTEQFLIDEHEFTVLANDWETTPFGPVTAIGRYTYAWWLEHGYLGDIFGHESDMVETCCECNDWDVCDNPCPFLEVPHYFDLYEDIYAISPDDVRMSGHWAWSWVMAMYEKGLTTGVSEFMYAPQDDVTRAEMAVFLARIMEDLGMAPLGVTTQFVDVPAGYWAYDEILLLKDYNVVAGYPGDGFMPEKTIKRDEMSKMLELAFNAIKIYSGADFYWDENLTVDPTGEIFADVGASYWAVQYIEELYFDGLTDGCGYDDENLYFCPDDLVTRAQMAKFVVTALQTEAETQGFWPVLAPEK